jgi:hypothetical protein
MWDYKSIVYKLQNADFVSIRKAEYGDSLDAAFTEVEDEERWRNCLGIECTKA